MIPLNCRAVNFWRHLHLHLLCPDSSEAMGQNPSVQYTEDSQGEWTRSYAGPVQQNGQTVSLGITLFVFLTLHQY